MVDKVMWTSCNYHTKEKGHFGMLDKVMWTSYNYHTKEKGHFGMVDQVDKFETALIF